MNVIYAPISIGELIDKLTILEIKKEQLTDPVRIANVLAEEQELIKLLDKSSIHNYSKIFNDLKEVNYGIWNGENTIRKLSKENRLDKYFIDTAVKIREYNDERSVIKHKLNLESNSKIIEEKSFFEN